MPAREDLKGFSFMAQRQPERITDGIGQDDGERVTKSPSER